MLACTPCGFPGRHGQKEVASAEGQIPAQSAGAVAGDQAEPDAGDQGNGKNAGCRSAYGCGGAMLCAGQQEPCTSRKKRQSCSEEYGVTNLEAESENGPVPYAARSAGPYRKQAHHDQPKSELTNFHAFRR
jgi:hypothetical protein